MLRNDGASRARPEFALRAGPDVAIMGGGPVGSAAALAFAQRGARVLVLESSLAGESRGASAFGEWLHPTALEALDRLGVSLPTTAPYETGRGFALFADDGGEPIVLPYPVGTFGWSLERSRLVDALRATLRRHELIEVVEGARVTRIDEQLLTYEKRNGTSYVVTAPLIVGATGRASMAHEAMYPHTPYGREASETLVSHTATLVLDLGTGAGELPFEGWAHLCLGGLGLAMAYRLDATRVRLQLDAPLEIEPSPSSHLALWDGFRMALPPSLREAFRLALAGGQKVVWTPNHVRPRQDYGRPGLALIGDAVGHHHPLAAIDLVLGLEDAASLAKSVPIGAEGSVLKKAHARWEKARIKDARIPELLAVALYEVLADPSAEVAALRRAMITMWRSSPDERLRTMSYLSGQNRNSAEFVRSCVSTLVSGAKNLGRSTWISKRLGTAPELILELARRSTWLGLGAVRATDPLARDAALRGGRSIRDRYGKALKVGSARRTRAATEPDRAPSIDVKAALLRGTEALIAKQADDGSFEGEVVWCPMLAAQYAIAWTLLGEPLSESRRRNLLQHFWDTRLPDGTWGLHELSEPYLFVTTLVYVASRFLGVAADDPRLAPARQMIEREGGVVGIPSWGKLWLAVAGLYAWEGVSPVLPETWLLPKPLPLHPSRWYCHTRNIYLAMATLYGGRHSAGLPNAAGTTSFARMTPDALAVRAALRDELFVGGFDRVDWKKARTTLRTAEIHTPWTFPLEAGYAVLKQLEPALPKGQRGALLLELKQHIRFEMEVTHHTCISPVSGLLGVLALRATDPNDLDAGKTIACFDGWIWEDDVKGARVTGARSASWDTGFAAQALAHAAPHVELPAQQPTRQALARADAFLASQQIRKADGRELEFFRIDPRGGYCFAGVWHGWPVSDCTAEAILGRIEAAKTLSRADAELAARFILRTQGADGGFGSYEPQRVAMSLEWINPAEMFGDSMTEKGYIECTASCIVALAAVHERFPDVCPQEIERAIQRAAVRLRATQRPDGAWTGMWGVHFIYGTLFGIRGLLAAGVPPTDPTVRAACAFIEAHQRSDGGWGESYRGIALDRFVEAERSHAVQTAWALSALLEAEHPRFATIERGARWLAAAQLPSGDWARQEPEGIFFHTALLEYELYRAYFPVWALALFEDRVRERRRAEPSKKADRAQTVSTPH
jgi:lanosterol synthase